MLVIVASRYDDRALALAERWGDARVLTPADLSLPGWRFISGDAENSTSVIDGAVVPTRAIHGVVTRLPSVAPEELPHIASADRTYVAAEMNAFLLAWLSELPCRVMNRPTPLCLSGPAWRREQWVRAAAAAGLDVLPATRRESNSSRSCTCTAGETGSPAVEVTVIAGVSPELPPALAEGMRRLAATARAELFTAQFTSLGDGARFVSAHLWPDVVNDEVALALKAALLEDAGVPR